MITHTHGTPMLSAGLTRAWLALGVAAVLGLGPAPLSVCAQGRPEIAGLADSSAAAAALHAAVEDFTRGSSTGPEAWPDLSESAAIARSAWARALHARVLGIPADALRGEAVWTRQILLARLEVEAEAAAHWTASTSDLTPYASPLRSAASRMAGLPTRSADERARWLRRQQAFAQPLRQARANVEIRAGRGVRLFAPALPAVRALLASYVRPDIGAPMMPTAEQLADLDPTVADAFVQSARAQLAADIVPAVHDVLAALGPAYEAEAPQGYGLWRQPGGRARYQHLIRRYTATDYTPEEIHRRGLAEVARIEGEMAALRAELGFRGTAREFLDSLRADPANYATSPEEMADRFRAYLRRIEPELLRVVRHLPAARGDVRRLDPRLEAVQTFGNYNRPSARDPNGHYAFNASRLAERPLLTEASLIYHELYPGHHLQSARQLENRALPEFRRSGADVSFGEAWGEYASALAGELGMYRTPVERYGLLLAQLFTSCRLVVDTGLNALGWSADSALAFLEARVAESRTQLETELLRYGTDYHAQALSYRLGALELQRLRHAAAAALGPNFDQRDFHEVILSGGQMPMSVLQARVDTWVRGQRAALHRR